MPVALDWDKHHELERIDILKVLSARRAPNGSCVEQRQ
jgi:hypothetical protein